MAGIPRVPLSQVLKQDMNYISELEPRMYPKLSVKLYGRGVSLDESADGATVKMTRHQLAKPGQVILSEIWAKKGAIGIVPPEGEGALVTSHFFLFDIDETKLFPRFIYWLLSRNYFADFLDAQAHGTTGYAAIRPKQFLALEIPLPPLDEQRRIVGRIEAMASRVREALSLRERAREEAEALEKSYLSHITVNLLEKYSHQTLENLTTMIGDMNHEMPKAVDNGIPFISPKDFSKHKTIDFIGSKKISSADFTRLSKKCCPQKGDILMARYGTIGAARFVDTDIKFLASYSISVIRPDNNKVDNQFLYWMVISPYTQGQAQKGIRGSGMADLGLKTIRQFTIPIPPLSEQRRIVAHLDAVQAKVDELHRLQGETREQLSALMPSILDRAFKGEL